MDKFLELILLSGYPNTWLVLVIIPDWLDSKDRNKKLVILALTLLRSLAGFLVAVVPWSTLQSFVVVTHHLIAHQSAVTYIFKRSNSAIHNVSNRFWLWKDEAEHASSHQICPVWPFRQVKWSVSNIYCALDLAQWLQKNTCSTIDGLHWVDGFAPPIAVPIAMGSSRNCDWYSVKEKLDYIACGWLADDWLVNDDWLIDP